MKSIFLTIILALAWTTAMLAQTPSKQAVEAYQAKKFDKAVELLQREVDIHKKLGQESAALYYNLGNAYFRADEMAKAILYYERALLLDPGNRDIRHNIAYVNTRIEDKIVKAENIFIEDWFDSIENIFSSNTWAVFAVAAFLLTIASCFFFFFGKHIWIKKTAFYSGLVSIAFVVLFNIFAFGQKSDVVSKNTAIIMAPSTQVLSSPDEKSKDLFNLHAGTKVKINKTDGQWFEIEIENGNVGWIQSNKLEII
jgi:tetratricopeptide (TPR) repeat protein